MESSSLADFTYFLRSDYLSLFVVRPLLAIAFVCFILFSGWWLAWKLVLVHVPLVQEIFGLRKKPVKKKPPTHHRLSRMYSTLNNRIQD